MKKLYFKIVKSYEEETVNNSTICFDIEIDEKYNSYELAKKEASSYSAILELIAGVWKIVIYKDSIKQMIIDWSDWYRYRCSKLKDSSNGVTFLDEYNDYEPCAIKFDEFASIMKRKGDLEKIPLRCIGNDVKPTF